MLDKIFGIIDKTSDITGKCVSFLTLGLVGFISYDVFMRYIFNAPTEWSTELSTYVFGTLWLLGGAYGMLHNAHVKLDVVYEHFPERIKAIMDVITFPIFLILTGVMLWVGVDFAVAAWLRLEHSNTVWGPPIYLVKTMIPLGALLIILQGLVKLVRDLRIVIHGAKGGSK